MNRKITSHERMEIEGRYYIHGGGHHRLKADVWLKERTGNVGTGLYLNQNATYGSGSIWVWCPETEEMLHVHVNMMEGKVEIELSGTMQSAELKDERRPRKPKGGEEE
jgi:hypothetical protein